MTLTQGSQRLSKRPLPERRSPIHSGFLQDVVHQSDCMRFPLTEQALLPGGGGGRSVHLAAPLLYPLPHAAEALNLCRLLHSSTRHRLRRQGAHGVVLRQEHLAVQLVEDMGALQPVHHGPLHLRQVEADAGFAQSLVPRVGLSAAAVEGIRARLAALQAEWNSLPERGTLAVDWAG